MLTTLSIYLRRHAFKISSNLRQDVSLTRYLYSRTPKPLLPYCELMRLDRPIGSLLLFYPCGWGLALAASPGCFPNLELLTLFAAGSFIMRGAGCTINDMWDKKIDSQVHRTKNRPLATGILSTADALAFLSLQLSAGLSLLLNLNFPSVLLGSSSMILVITYPLFKRFTYWPQMFLGLTFNWGALLSWCAVHGTLDPKLVFPLYAAGISWTLFYDTVYAHQDRRDDSLIGIKSTALKFGDSSGRWLLGFSTLMTSSLLWVGIYSEQNWPFYVSLTYMTAILLKQIRTLDIHDSEDLFKKFVSHQKIGLAVFLGIVFSTYIKTSNYSSK